MDLTSKEENLKKATSKVKNIKFVFQTKDDFTCKNITIKLPFIDITIKLPFIDNITKKLTFII